MISTIQLNKSVKEALDRLKETSKESYEEVIVAMMHYIEKQKRQQKGLLIEQCKVMAKDDLKTCNELEQADAELDWEWNENAN